MCTHVPKASPFLEVHVGGETLPIQLPSLWSRTSPLPFHQIVEANSGSVTSTWHEADYISRRYNSVQSNLRRDLERQGHPIGLWLLQQLGFVINWKKSVLIPAQTMEYLGFLINSLEITLALPEEKIQNLIQSCRQLLQSRVSYVREIAKLVGKLTSSMQAILPAPLHYRHLQMLQIKSLLAGRSYETEVTPNQSCKDDLQWWIDQITNWNGRAIPIPAPDIVITTDASLKRWGAVCQGVRTRGLWTPQEASPECLGVDGRIVCSESIHSKQNTPSCTCDFVLMSVSHGLHNIGLSQNYIASCTGNCSVQQRLKGKGLDYGLVY